MLVGTQALEVVQNTLGAFTQSDSLAWTRQFLKGFRYTLPRRELSQPAAPLYLFPGYGCSLLKALFGLQLLPEQLRRLSALEIVEHGFHGFVRSKNFANSQASIPGVRLGQYAIALFI